MSQAGKLIASALLALGRAQATDPASVQDPPGEVDVRQPAGVSLPERNTDEDTTDTLRGGRTEVIQGESAEARASESRTEVAPGAEARAGFEEGTPSASTGGTSEDDGPADSAESTSLGTDTGHGTGTEVEAPSPSGR
jgi:hypothetical protein